MRETAQFYILEKSFGSRGWVVEQGGFEKINIVGSEKIRKPL